MSYHKVVTSCYKRFFLCFTYNILGCITCV